MGRYFEMAIIRQLKEGHQMSYTHRKVLVVGLLPYDAGKTTLCKALIHGFKKSDVNLVPFKPHSGISYWKQFKTFHDGLIRGALLSSDIIELEDAARSGLPLELLNPANRLSSPILDQGMSEEKLAFQEFVAQRFTHHEEANCRSIYYLNGAINLNHMRGMREFLVAIKKNTEKVIFIRNFQQLVKAYEDNFEKATGSCYRALQDKPLIVESFNDAAYPFGRAEDCGVVLCMSSSIVLRFKAQEYFKAIGLRAQQKPKAQLTTTDLYSASLVERRYELQPLTDEERNEPERLVENYSKIIDELVKV
jgi:predicted P-loop ATPase/GTPase